MESKFVQTPQDQLTYKIIGCAMAAHRELGPGYRENTYQRALEARLSDAGLAFEAQKVLAVHDNGVLVGYYIPDFIVAGTVPVEIKALRGLDNDHLAQIIGYLAVTGAPLGLLINFGRRSLEYHRIFPPKDVAAHHVNRRWLFVPDWLQEEQQRISGNELTELTEQNQQREQRQQNGPSEQREQDEQNDQNEQDEQNDQNEQRQQNEQHEEREQHERRDSTD